MKHYSVEFDRTTRNSEPVAEVAVFNPLPDSSDEYFRCSKKDGKFLWEQHGEKVNWNHNKPAFVDPVESMLDIYSGSSA